MQDLNATNDVTQQVESKSKLAPVKNALNIIVKTLLISVITVLSVFIGYQVYRYGYQTGYKQGQINAENYYLDYLDELNQKGFTDAVITPVISQSPRQIVLPTKVPTWGGPELWDAVNKRRVQFGVNPLKIKEDLCTIASIRLNELIALGRLDGHEGFSKLKDDRPDLKHIFDSYSTMAEFLALGGSSAQDTVSLWENTLGHKQLLTGGEYVWGCIYAQNTFAVAIAAY